MSDPTADLAHLWEWFAENQCRGYSPLYEQICRAVAGDRDLLELVRSAPPAAHMPPALLGAVHYLLLEGLEHPLADVYAGRSDADPAPLFVDVCRARRDDVVALLSTRHIQTNECGRSAVIGPGLTWLSSRLQGAFALIDVGASAGLNLLCDHYRIDYGAHGATGPAGSPVEIRCHVLSGDPPIADSLPTFVTRVGIDRSPIDLANPDDARWLLACVWPDTGRLERTAACIRLAQEHRPEVIAGDANHVLPAVLAELPEGTTAVAVTTWAFAYLTIEERRRFIEVLERASYKRPVAWLSAEGAGIVDAFDGHSGPSDERAASDVLGAVTFDCGRRARSYSPMSISTAVGSTGEHPPSDAGSDRTHLGTVALMPVHINLAVADVARSLAFHRRWLGFGSDEKWFADGTVFVRDAEGTDLAFHEGQVPAAPAPTVHFGFRRGDLFLVRNLHAGLVSAGVSIAEFENEDALVSVKFDDRDGYEVEVY